MIFDFIVIYAYFFGSLLIILFTLLRYSVGTDKYGKIMRLINACKVVSLRTKTLDSLGMLFQCTGVVFLLTGTAHGIIHERFVIEGLLDDCLLFLVVLIPITLLAGGIAFLRKFYWR